MSNTITLVHAFTATPLGASCLLAPRTRSHPLCWHPAHLPKHSFHQSSHLLRQKSLVPEYTLLGP